MPITDFFSEPPPAGLAARRPFIKMHGLRNHFVFVDLRRGGPALAKAEIIRACDVHEGVGADQVIAIEPPSPAGSARGASVFMRILNIDGAESEACGNATRCMAQLLFDETGQDEALIETRGGILRCARAGENVVSAVMGPIRPGWRDVPLAHAADTLHLPLRSGPLRDGVALNIGNPHAVFFVPDFDAVDIAAVAPAIARDPLFPQSVNVGVAQVTGPGSLRLQVWERPGLLTEACGTGACAAAYAARRRGLVSGDDITVRLPAGELQIRLIANDGAVMTGPVAFCCFGYV